MASVLEREIFGGEAIMLQIFRIQIVLGIPRVGAENRTSFFLGITKEKY